MLKSNRGFTLIELMVTLAIMSTSVLAVAAISIQQLKAKNAIESAAAFYNVRNSSMMALRNSKVCANRLKPKSGTTIDTTIDTSSTPMQIYTGSDNASLLVEDDLIRDRLKYAVRLQIRSTPTTIGGGAQRYLAAIMITGDRDGGNFGYMGTTAGANMEKSYAGQRELYAEIPIAVTVTPGGGSTATIQSCQFTSDLPDDDLLLGSDKPLWRCKEMGGKLVTVTSSGSTGNICIFYRTSVGGSLSCPTGWSQFNGYASLGTACNTPGAGACVAIETQIKTGTFDVTNGFPGGTFPSGGTSTTAGCVPPPVPFMANGSTQSVTCNYNSGLNTFSFSASSRPDLVNAIGCN